MTRRQIFPAVPGCVVLFFLVTYLYAQDAGAPRVLMRSFPESPAAGSRWTLILHIDHPVPGEVTVLAPAFSGLFFLDRTLKSSLTMTDAESPERWTEVEYNFSLAGAGSFTLDPFTVITPAGEVRTDPVTVNVRNAGNAVSPPVVSWAEIPSQMSTGEAASFCLRLNGWERPFPPARIFMPPLHDGAIIEASELTGADMEAAYVLRLRLFPLKAAPLVFPERIVVYDNVTFRIPPLSIAVAPSPRQNLPAPGTNPSAADHAGAPPPSSVAGVHEAVNFPAMETPLLRGGISPLLVRLGAGFFLPAYEAVYFTAENLWSRGYHAESLALLRQNERDHIFGPLFLPLRIQAEQNLGLRYTKNETPRVIILFFSGLCLVLAIAAALLCVRRSKAGRKWIPLFAIVILSCAMPVLYFATPLYKAFPFGAGRSGVIRETAAWLVPDPSGQESGRFREGQPVNTGGKKFLLRRDSWIWVETGDGEGVFGISRRKEPYTGGPWASSSGWVPREQIIFY